MSETTAPKSIAVFHTSFMQIKKSLSETALNAAIFAEQALEAKIGIIVTAMPTAITAIQRIGIDASEPAAKQAHAKITIFVIKR